ncbi:MAG: Gfo/Idh/MocA family oxidoreductase [Caldilineaceae bacterium]
MINIAIVGCGRILNAHLQGYKKLREAGIDNFRITALVARKEEDGLMFLRRGEGPTPRPPVLDPATGDPLAAPHTYLSDFQDDVHAKVYTDYRQMLDEAPVDAVNDFTTLALHHQVAEESLHRGKHLLTQKPLAISVRAAQRMVNLAKERKLTLGTFENVRQGRYTRAAGWAVSQGLIGDPQMALMGSLGGLWSPDRVVAETPWRHDKLLGGGGGSIDIGVHQFHFLRYVFGEVAWVSAVARTFEPTRTLRDSNGTITQTVQANVDDTYLATCGFENDAIGQLLWSWAGRGAALEIPGTPVFFGSEGCIKGGQLIDQAGNEVNLLEHFDTNLDAQQRDQFFPLGFTDAYAIQQLDWLQSIEQGKDPETSGVEGLHDLACAFAMLESSQARHQVTLQEILSGQVDGYQREIDQHYQLV